VCALFLVIRRNSVHATTLLKNNDMSSVEKEFKNDFYIEHLKKIIK
jgi:hypothetical protein